MRTIADLLNEGYAIRGVTLQNGKIVSHMTDQGVITGHLDKNGLIKPEGQPQPPESLEISNQETRQPHGCPYCNHDGPHQYEDEYICVQNNGPCAQDINPRQ